MTTILGRPVGLVFSTLLLAINGVAAILEAVGSAEFPNAGVSIAGSVFSTIIGLALIYRAYGLWNFHFGAWLITLALLCLRAVLMALSLAVMPASIAVWIDLALIVVAVLYLVQPSVRDLFSRGHAGG